MLTPPAMPLESVFSPPPQWGPWASGPWANPQRWAALLEADTAPGPWANPYLEADTAPGPMAPPYLGAGYSREEAR
jgi:hypothetical protein